MSNKGEQKGISALDFFCVGFGAIVGVGWAMSLNGWIAKSGGPIPASLGYILALVLMVPVALCYCELAPMMPVAGGGTAYAYRAFNEKIAFISGWAAFGGFVTIIPWEAIYVCNILSILFPVLKGPLLYTVPFGLMDEAGEVFLGQIIFGVIFSTLLFYVNWRGATTSAVFQRCVTLVLVGAGVLAMIVALGKFDAANIQPIYENVGRGDHSGFVGGMIATLAAAPFFLAGFETIPQAVEDAKGDITSVGKTVVLSVAMACIFYALLIFTLGASMPWKEIIPLSSPAASNIFLISYKGAVIGQIMYYVILVGTLCGLFSTWNGFMMASPRLLMGMSRGYMMPRALAKQNSYGTPTNGLIACYVLSLAGPFLSMRLIEPLTLFAAAGFVLSWMITSFSVVMLRKNEPDAERPYRLPGGSATAAFGGIAMLVVFVMLFAPSPVRLSNVAMILFFCWMAIGLVFYLIAGSARKSVSAEERSRSLFERR